MNARTLASSRLAVVVTILGSLIRISPAHAGGGFLWLPFSSGTQSPGDCRGNCTATGVCIYCRWSDCVDGATYNHQATDYGCTGNSTEVRAAADGEVIHVRSNIPRNTFPLGGAYGNIVKIRHGTGHETWYAHLLPGIRVARGARVTAGQLLGLSDNTGMSTGPHLHFEVRDPQGRRVNPYGDPPDYTQGCGPNALWVTCPPTPAPPPDADGDGISAAAGDCDDTNRDVHPGAAETCNDRDDDCSGTADDPWRAGLAQDIGNPCTVGTGICLNAGTWVCAPDGRATACNVDPLPPQPESCNGLDDDCDGGADEDWRTGLAQDISNPCAIEWDACRGSTSGMWMCAPGGLSTICDASMPGGTPATAEICNSVDDDCDSVTDNVPDRTIVEYAAEPSAILTSLSSALDGTRERLGVSWIEIRPDATGFSQLYTLHFVLLDRDGNPIGGTRSLSSVAYPMTYDQAIGWNGEEYGVIWRIFEEPSLSSERELLFIRLDPDGVPYAEPVTVGEPLLISGVPVPDIDSQTRLVATSDGWLAAEGGPFSQQDANRNLYGNIILSRFSRDGAAIGTPIFVNDDRSRQVDPAAFGLLSVAGREALAWAIYRREGSAGRILGEVWEGSTRVQQVTLLTSEPNDSLSRPITACTGEMSCWISWYQSQYLGGGTSSYALSLGTFDVDALTITPVEMVTPPDRFSAYDLACAGTGCTLAIVARAIDGFGYTITIVTTASDGTAPTIVRTIAREPSTDTLTGSLTVQRLDTRSVVVWNQTNRHIRTVVCH